MTAIAAFMVDGCPVVFGDLLITGPSEEPSSIHLPAVGDASGFFEDSGWAILTLQQKVVVINDCCALAWAGSWVGARVAVAELRSFAARGALTRDSVEEFLSTQVDVQKHGTSFVGWVHEEARQRFGQFRHRAETLEAGSFGRMSLQGSGSAAIKEFVELCGHAQMSASGAVNPAVSAIATGLSMGGALLRAELHGHHAAPTLRAMFGGGYEVAAFSNGGFRKVGDFTYVVWEARLASGGAELFGPQLLVKQAYVDDVLLLRSARVVPEGGRLVVVDEQGHAVRPMYDVPTRPDRRHLADLSLDSPLLCHCVFARGEHDGEVALYTKVERASPSRMTIECAGSELRIRVRQDLWENLRQSIQEAMIRGRSAANRQP